jgi:hypothetical protein
MRYAALLLILFACTTDDLVLSDEEQAVWDGGPDDPDGEVIVIEGETGWPDWWFPGPDSVPDPGDTGGNGGGGPGPVAARGINRSARSARGTRGSTSAWTVASTTTIRWMGGCAGR